SRIKLHSVEIAQGPLARWRGYASLRFGLAGGALAFDGLPLDEAWAMRSAVLDSIASVDFSALPR
ncbi:MAG TPA: PH domain-containing protein, partial [Paracoccaceae bacterium]|nr:PH domain-containing protein [Paracoccaceae bacterium]